ncbi:MAG: hypothetical protein AAFX99_37285, partial [Myxococcota bacterium]
GSCINGLCVDTERDAGTDDDVIIDNSDASLVVDDTGTGLPDTPVTTDNPFGSACTEDSECASGICMPDPFGAQFCTEPCPDAVCPHDGFDCILYEASEAEPQLLCTPEDDILCATCKDDTECAALGSSCITLSDGQACATACGQDGLCPVGFRCTPQLGGEGREVCLPTSSMCAGCVDGDDDSYGVGRLCE